MRPIEEQVAILMQGSEYGDEGLKEAMTAELRDRLVECQKEGRPLRVYCGFDPTSTDLHLGHTIPMYKLRQFQELGHDVTFLIGSYTSLIGDPSDKDRLRPRLTFDQVMRNAETYAQQAFRILDPERTAIKYNHEWLEKVTFEELIGMASHFTVQQFLTRENFRLRWERGDAIYLHELFYALMQGYDAVVQETDVQVGGSEQLFNIITAGRKLQPAFGQRPQVGIVMGILPGTDGKVRMSKSLGNHIPILAPPEDMFGKVMSLPDDVMPLYFKLATRYEPPQIAAIEKALTDGSRHPMEIKMELAREIVSIFHDETAAQEAEAHFRQVFQRQELPEDMPVFELSAPMTVVDLVAAAGLTRSKSEARRMVQQKAVSVDGIKVSTIDLQIDPISKHINAQLRSLVQDIEQGMSALGATIPQHLNDSMRSLVVQIKRDVLGVSPQAQQSAMRQLRASLQPINDEMRSLGKRIGQPISDEMRSFGKRIGQPINERILRVGRRRFLRIIEGSQDPRCESSAE